MPSGRKKLLSQGPDCVNKDHPPLPARLGVSHDQREWWISIPHHALESGDVTAEGKAALRGTRCAAPGPHRYTPRPGATHNNLVRTPIRDGPSSPHKPTRLARD